VKINKSNTTFKVGGIALLMVSLVLSPSYLSHACTRIVYETGNATFITGRTMDWMDPSAKTALWVFPGG
jgi:penicillin V acylase-like amidase (Ntn superfamily)